MFNSFSNSSVIDLNSINGTEMAVKKKIKVKNNDFFVLRSSSLAKMKSLNENKYNMQKVIPSKQ